MNPLPTHSPYVARFFRMFLAGTLALFAGCATDETAPGPKTEEARGARLEATALHALLGGAYRLGNPRAGIVVIEFTDFQCPHCRRYHEGTFRELRRRYVDTGVVQYVVRDFPLGSHAHAFGAALAAHCAAAQGRYWEMSDGLFANQDKLGDVLYATLARDIGLTMPDFDACLKSPATRRAVNYSVTVGARLGVGGTPTLLLGRVENGALEVARVVLGTPDLESFALDIEMLRR